jgi:hypothetical protein
MLPGYNGYTANQGQSLPDICLNTYGSLDYLVQLMTDNGLNDFNYMPAPGQVLQWNPALTTDQRIAQLNYIYATYANTTAGRNFDSNFDNNFD